MPTDFTPEEATSLIEEWSLYLDKAKAATEAGRFVEAESWIDRLKIEMDEQDVFPALAAHEVGESVRHLGQQSRERDQ